MPTMNKKEIQFVATRTFSEKFGPFGMILYVSIALSVLNKYPVDMLVFETNNDGNLLVRLAGYDFNTNILDETTVALETKWALTEKFWLKIDDYESYYAATFLFPDEY